MTTKKTVYLRGKKKNMYLPPIILLFSLFFIHYGTFAQNADFSGTWKLNESKSNLGEGGFRGGSSSVTIHQEGNNLTTERAFVNRNGEEMKNTEKFTLDGKKCENTTRNQTRTTTVTWSEDGKMLTFSSVMVFERQGETMEIKSTEKWGLSDGGKSLTIDSTSQTPRGERKATLVYDKQ